MSRRSARIGQRVRRGCDWRWGEQDGGGAGTIVALDASDFSDGWVRVEWDVGGAELYRVGLNAAHDLTLDGDIRRYPAIYTGTDVHACGLELVTTWAAAAWLDTWVTGCQSIAGYHPIADSATAQFRVTGKMGRGR